MMTDVEAIAHIRQLKAVKANVIYVTAWGPTDDLGLYSKFDVEVVQQGVQAHLIEPIPDAHIYVGWRNVDRAIEAVSSGAFDNLDGEMDYD